MVPMILASKTLKKYIEIHSSNEIIANRWDTTRQTVHNIMHDKQNISSELIAIILNDTGMKFESAFEVTENE